MTGSRGLPVVEQADADLVHRARAGDDDAFARIVARYRDRYARFAVHMLGSAADAEDVLQDTFVRAYRSLSRCDDPSRFDAWLFSILINRCRTAGARRHRRERTLVRDDGALEGALEEHPAERDAWREEIRFALAKLPDEQREAFLLKHVEDLGYEEMAMLTGASVSALKMRVKRACERLRELLREVYDD
ncbi:MAG TPA: RNA polymerase sigma factor [Gemmatimonadaceae bacterium]|nr:RNA polymerase sigma factor [Gemmatimonadaceae bacterium]